MTYFITQKLENNAPTLDSKEWAKIGQIGTWMNLLKLGNKHNNFQDSFWALEIGGQQR